MKYRGWRVSLVGKWLACRSRQAISIWFERSSYQGTYLPEYPSTQEQYSMKWQVKICDSLLPGLRNTHSSVTYIWPTIGELIFVSGTFVQLISTLHCVHTSAIRWLTIRKMSISTSQNMMARGKYLQMFRKLVRKVILKRFWQGIFDANLELNKLRNTSEVFRRIGKKEILFQSEKRILGIPYKERDAVQKKIGELIICRLHCLEIFEPVRKG